MTPDSCRQPNLDTSTLNRVIAVSPAQAAKLVGVGRTTIYEALGSGALASYLVGRRRLILITDLEAWIRRTPAPLPRLKPRVQREGELPRIGLWVGQWVARRLGPIGRGIVYKDQ